MNMKLFNRNKFWFWLAACCLLVVLSFNATPAWALEVNVGQQVELDAKKPIGVPLHRLPQPSLFSRVEDETVATVIGLDSNRHWINIELPNERRGWIVERYVARVLSEPQVPEVDPTRDDVFAVWSSARQCEAVVRAGRQLPRTEDDAIRLATWNIRWFPDSEIAEDADGTNLRWLACTMAWMNPDVLAVQESRTTSEAEVAWDNVTDGIAGLIGGDWRVQFNTCGSGDQQHVGFLWNASRIDLEEAREVWEFNGRADDASKPCAGNLRPGFLARFESQRNDGFDFYALSVHQDSGVQFKDFQTRQTALERIDVVASQLVGEDEDIIILGDFNTMGMTGSQAVSDEEEIDTLKTVASKEEPGFICAGAEPECTHYFRQQPGWLDHILLTKQTQERLTTTATVSSYCALNDCKRIVGSMPDAAEQLSDHCPVLIDFANRDLDS
jgi:exonuclease III